jgi:hypothetical protein
MSFGQTVLGRVKGPLSVCWAWQVCHNEFIVRKQAFLTTIVLLSVNLACMPLPSINIFSGFDLKV